MAIDYAMRYAKQIDERFTSTSYTEPAVNRDFDLAGSKTVKLYSVSTAPMNDYRMQGSNRYGDPDELDTTTQEVTMTQDKAFTFTVDKRNNDETGGALDAGRALQRQQDEVITPMIDAYRLNVMADKAGSKVVSAYTGTNAVGPYEQYLDGIAAMKNARVPVKGCVMFASTKFYKAMKLDPNFVHMKDISEDKLTNGQVGRVDFTPVIEAVDADLPTGLSMLIAHPMATTACQKIAEYRIHDNPPGISGQLAEGRVYFDAFVRSNKRMALYALFGELGSLTMRLAAGGSGKTHAAVTGNGSQTLRYKTGASQAAPGLGDDISGWTAFPADGEIAVTATHYLVVASEVNGKAVACARMKVSADQIGA